MLEGAFAGRWWLPGDPHRTWGGILTLADGHEPQLHITGVVTEDLKRRIGSVVVEHPAVHGITADGKAVTLVSAAETGGQMNLFAPEAGDTIITAPRAYVGGHFRSEAAARFRRLHLKLSLLDSWLPPPQINREVEVRHGKLRRSSLTYEAGRDIWVDAGVVKLNFGHDFAATGNLRTEAGFAQSGTIVATTSRKQPVGWWLSTVVKPLRYLISISTELPIAVVSLRLHPWARANGESVEVVWANDIPQDGARDLHQAQMLMWYGDLAERVQPALRHWLKAVGELEEILDQFFATLHPSRTFVETRFTMTVSAAEAYHRERIRGTDAPPDVHDKRTRQARSGVDAVHLQWLNQRIGGNEPTLLRRITELCEAIPEVAALVVGPDVNAFARAVRDARNFRTHLDDTRHSAPETLHLVRLTAQLGVILEAVILNRELGFEPADILQRVRRASRLHRLAARLGSPGQ